MLVMELYERSGPFMRGVIRLMIHNEGELVSHEGDDETGLEVTIRCQVFDVYSEDMELFRELVAVAEKVEFLSAGEEHVDIRFSFPPISHIPGLLDEEDMDDL